MMTSVRFSLLAVALLALAAPATADTFTLHLYDLQGNPIITPPTVASVVQVFEQLEGQDTLKILTQRTIRVNETARQVAGPFPSIAGTNRVVVNVPTGVNTQALVFVVRRFDEGKFTAFVPFLVMPADAEVRTYDVNVAVPKSTRPAARPGNCCHYHYRRCHRRCH